MQCNCNTNSIWQHISKSKYAVWTIVSKYNSLTWYSNKTLVSLKFCNLYNYENMCLRFVLVLRDIHFYWAGFISDRNKYKGRNRQIFTLCRNDRFFVQKQDLYSDFLQIQLKSFK